MDTPSDDQPSEAEEMREWQRAQLERQKAHMAKRLEGLEKARKTYREGWKK